MAINQINVNLWIEDLLSPPDGLQFNPDYACVTDERGRPMGDAALFLAYRQANINNRDDIYAWYDNFSKTAIPPGGYHPSEVILNVFAGIPLADACKLIWSPLLFLEDFPPEKLNAKLFVSVLRHYLKTGEVEWYLMAGLESYNVAE